MAKSGGILQKLAKKSPQYKVGLLVLALLLGLGVYYQACYSELSAQEDTVDQRKSSLLAQERTLDKQLIEQEELTARYEELQRSIRDNQKALPSEAELPAFYDHLQRKAGDTGVSILKWDRMDEQAVDIYIRVPVSVEISGTFYEVMHYFSLLGPQKKDELQAAGTGDNTEGPRIDERIVSIENLELGTAKLKDGELILKAKFVASTFRQNEAEGASGKPGAKPGKSNAKAGLKRVTGGGVDASIGAATGGKSKKQPARKPAPAGGTRSGGGSFGGSRRSRKRSRHPVRLSADPVRLSADPVRLSADPDADSGRDGQQERNVT